MACASSRILYHTALILSMTINGESNMHGYLVTMEIEGATAMWTRPDTGDCPVSYPAPTYSAVQGMFKAVCWGPAIEIVPYKVEICRPLHYHNYQTNYNGPLRNPKSVKEGNPFQMFATVLTNVCYRLYAYVYPIRQRRDGLPQKAKEWDRKTTSPGHAYQSIFNRRLQRGTWFALPCLGWREFTPSYVGPLRPETRPYEGLSTVIPSMLREVFPDGNNSPVRFTYDQNVKIEKGVLHYTNPLREGYHD